MEQVMVEKLIDTAIEQLKFSYTPYSNFKVGAALLAKNGEIFTGCNIENASYTPTNCAERTAFFNVASCIYLTTFCQQCRTYVKTGIRRIRIRHSLDCAINQSGNHICI